MTSGERQSELSGKLVDDASTLRWASDDWGHIVHHTPRAVYRPVTPDDVANAVRFASERQLRLVPRGHGHSCNGQAQSPGGIVIDMTWLNQIHQVTTDHIVVDAGSRWSQVLAATLPRGLTPPVLTDYLELTVGGTLSVGGIAGTSHRHGLQTDNVLELDVVTPDGIQLTCSPTHQLALFDQIRAGRGDHGIITRATLRLVNAHTHVARQKLRYQDLEQFLVDQRALISTGLFDYVAGQAKADGEAWQYIIETAQFHNGDDLSGGTAVLDRLRYDRATSVSSTMTYAAFLTQFAPEESRLRATGAWHNPHPWITVFLPESTAHAVISRTLAGQGLHTLGETGRVIIYPFLTDMISTPSVPVPNEPTAYMFSLLRTGTSVDPFTTVHMIKANLAFADEVRAAGGHIYL